MQVRLKRVYEPPSSEDGFRILVDRLWPRGLSKEQARIDHWLREIAPSDELRRWFGHDPQRWEEFRQRYFAELDEIRELLRTIRTQSSPVVTLLFAAKDTERNNAVALTDYLRRTEEGETVSG